MFEALGVLEIFLGRDALSGRAIGFVLALCLMASANVYAQMPVLDVAGVPTIVRNSTANMHAQGDSLWVGIVFELNNRWR